MDLDLIKHLCRVTTLAGYSLATGCGGGDVGGGSAPQASPVELAAPWTSYCVATFDTDHDFRDGAGDLEFTAKAGERYLIGELGEFRSSVIVPTDAGPFPFSITPADGEPFPFSTNCKTGMTKSYRGVFADVTIYGDSALTKSPCTLKAGTLVEDDGSRKGYGRVQASFQGPALYEVWIGALASKCDGRADGFIELQQANVFGDDTWLVPFADFVGPL